MNDLPTKFERRDFGREGIDELTIEPVDEQALQAARERSAARVRLLWNGRRFLIHCSVWGLILATVIAFLIPNRYEATASLMPPDQTSGMAGAMLAALSNRMGSGITSVAQNMLGMKTTGDLFIGILKSDSVQDDVIHKFNLQKLYKDRYIEDARKDLAKHTDVTEDPKSGIVTIKVTDRSPKRAAAMTQEYVDQLNWVVTFLSTSSAHKERIFLDSRLEQVKSDLESSEKAFSQFASQKEAIDIPTQAKAMVAAAATVQGELIAAQSELQGLRQIYTDDNSRVRSLEARVTELRDALAKMGGANATDKSGIQDIYPSLRELPVLGVTYADLVRRTKVEEAVFETLTQQDELAKVEEAKEIPSVKLLDEPKPPEKKSFPPRPLLVILGGLLGLVFGCALILVDSAWKKTNDPRKSLVIDVWSDFRNGLHRPDSNGFGASSHNGASQKLNTDTGVVLEDKLDARK